MPVPRLRPRSPAWLRWPRRTARFRFSAVYGGLFLVSGAVLLATTYVLFERATEYTKPQLPKIPHTPAIQHVPQLAQVQRQLAQHLPPLAQALPQLAQAQYQLAVDRHQLVLRRPPGPLAQAGRRAGPGPASAGRGPAPARSGCPSTGRGGPSAGTGRAVQAAQRSADSHQLLVNSGTALAIVAVLALLAGWLVAGRMLRPIRAITRTAQRISSTSLHERLALDGPQDELKELGDTLDDLFGRLDAAFDAQRHFVANASHELRTPITAERNLLQVALDDPHTSAEEWRATAEELLASNDEQKHLIEALLTLASSESGLDHRERADLADICQSVLARPGLDTYRLGLHVEAAVPQRRSKATPALVERLVATSSTTPSGTTSQAGTSRSRLVPQAARPCYR